VIVPAGRGGGERTGIRASEMEVAILQSR
jgi:hypothetical protein